MAFFGFLLAVFALIWTYRNRRLLERLEEKQLQLRKESAHISAKLEKIASALSTLQQAPSQVAPPPKPHSEPAQTPAFESPPIAMPKPAEEDQYAPSSEPEPETG